MSRIFKSLLNRSQIKSSLSSATDTLWSGDSMYPYDRFGDMMALSFVQGVNDTLRVLLLSVLALPLLGVLLTAEHMRRGLGYNPRTKERKMPNFVKNKNECHPHLQQKSKK
eukprot:1083319-Amphidinium_carterae.1